MTKSRRTSHIYFGEKIMFLRLIRAEVNFGMKACFYAQILSPKRPLKSGDGRFL